MTNTGTFYCSECGTLVEVEGEGCCPAGHPRSSLRRPMNSEPAHDPESDSAAPESASRFRRLTADQVMTWLVVALAGSGVISLFAVMAAGPGTDWSSSVFEQGVYLCAYGSFLYVWGGSLISALTAQEELIQLVVNIVVGGLALAIPYLIVVWLATQIQETAVGGVYAPQWLRNSGQTTVVLITLAAFAVLAATPQVLEYLGINHASTDGRQSTESTQTAQWIFAGCLALGMGVTQLLWPGAAVRADGSEYLAGAVLLSWSGLLLGLISTVAAIGWMQVIKLRKAASANSDSYDSL